MNKYEEFIQSIRESRENKYFLYSERHHIVPRCLGGTDDDENLIYLTYQEHFIAHLLLSDEQPESEGLIRAVMIMSKNMTIDEEEYARLKKRFADSQIGNKHFEGKEHSDEWKEQCSTWMKGRKQCLGKIWVHSESGASLMVDPSEVDEYISEGWERGRGQFQSDEVREYCRKSSEGRMWITNGSVSKMIYSSEEVPSGWYKGRTMKHDRRGRFISSGK